jgi:hypothetical protein
MLVSKTTTAFRGLLGGKRMFNYLQIHEIEGRYQAQPGFGGHHPMSVEFHVADCRPLKQAMPSGSFR